MQASIFMFATDLHDEGFDTVLGRIMAAGLNGTTLACSYHHARDIFPHNPVRRVRFLDGGAVFFQPKPDDFRGLRIQPHVSALAREHDILATLAKESERRGLAVRAWTVFLHNTTLGTRHPECTIHNAFGDPYITCLCPANPDVRAYAQALATSIAGYGVESILAESLAFQPFDHGYHHERSFVPLSPVTRFLLGLCFCEHCISAARQAGVDADQLRDAVRTVLDDALRSGTLIEGNVEREPIAAMFGGELGRYLEMREAVVTSLVGDVAAAVEAVGSAHFIVMEMSGAAKGYATGEPTGDAAPSMAWQDGVDVAAVSRVSHGVEAIGYARDTDRLQFDLEAYRRLLPEGTSLSAAMRPMLPDCDGPENLRHKMQLARRLGLEWVDFYHYGFMPLDRLDWIRAALNADGAHLDVTP